MIKRSSYKKYIEPRLGKEKILVLKGARQVGKTTLMRFFEQSLQEKGEDTVFLFADDITHNYFETPEGFISYLKTYHGFLRDERNEKKIYVFIDEFQYIEQAGLFLKNIFDRYKNHLQLIVSGSSSLEITKNTEFLTGRAITFYIDRVGFDEFFRYKTGIQKFDFSCDNFDEGIDFFATAQFDLEKTFLEYITYGGYPEGIMESSIDLKERLIGEIIRTYIEKDVAQLLNVDNISGFNNLIKVLCSNIGDLLNIQELANTLNLSMPTINKYIDILEGTFIFSRVTPYFTNTRKELSKMPKIYVEDLAIKNYQLRDFSSIGQKINLGSEVENFVYNHLSKGIDKQYIHFYRTASKSEIDFVVERPGDIFDIIEVKRKNSVSIPGTFTRFEKKYTVGKKIIITKNIMKYEDGVYFIPACMMPFILL